MMTKMMGREHVKAETVAYDPSKTFTAARAIKIREQAGTQECLRLWRLHSEVASCSTFGQLAEREVGLLVEEAGRWVLDSPNEGCKTGSLKEVCAFDRAAASCVHPEM